MSSALYIVSVVVYVVCLLSAAHAMYYQRWDMAATMGILAVLQVQFQHHWLAKQRHEELMDEMRKLKNGTT